MAQALAEKLEETGPVEKSLTSTRKRELEQEHGEERVDSTVKKADFKDKKSMQKEPS